MTLIATVAHPRAWPPKEGGFWDLFWLFIWHDPVQLVVQVAPIGTNFAKPGDSVYLKIDESVPDDGMLWMLANDHWMAACDNSGAVRLEIEHVAAREAGKPLWTLQRDKGGTPCEHKKLRRLKTQTEDDQTSGEQPRTVWHGCPKLPQPPGIVEMILAEAKQVRWIGRWAGRTEGKGPYAAADERQLETQHPGR